jgi:Fe-S cluster assembly protein SufD
MSMSATEFQQQALRLAAQQQPLQWLNALRAQAQTAWLTAAWPTKKTERWMYTPLQSLQTNIPQTWAGPIVNQAMSSSHLTHNLLNIDATRLVFVNGVFDAKESQIDSDNVVRFSSANSEQQKLIQQYLGKILTTEQHLFATLNNAWLDDGVLIHVAAKQRLTKPIYIINKTLATDQPLSSNQRVLIVLDEMAEAEIIEHYCSDDSPQNAVINAVTEIHLGNNAQLHHYRLNLEEEHARHLGAVHADLMANSRLRAFAMALGSSLMRIDYQINHRGKAAELDLQGVYLPRNNQLVDYHTNVCHWVGHCTTREIFRGIINDSARAVFNGRIYIHPQAQKTQADLSNKNLLTSNKAEVDTKPELEIYADDVKCSHGATVSQLNAQALYYLQSRGIPLAQAKVMLSFGFINELLEQVAQPSVRDYLTPLLSTLFGKGHESLELMNDNH